MSDQIAEPEQLSQVANIRQQFEQRGFRFTDGKLGEQPRCFGIAKQCTLELVGEAAVEQATMVAVMAHDAENTARLNGFRVAALMALLAGQAGVVWIGDAMKQAQSMPGQKPKVEGALGGWKVTLTLNRQKSAVTLKARGAQLRPKTENAPVALLQVTQEGELIVDTRAIEAFSGIPIKHIKECFPAQLGPAP